MTKDNFFRIVADSQPVEKGWLSTLRCGHKVKRDIQEMPGFGVWCVECEVEGSKEGSKKEKESKKEKGKKKDVPQTERHTSPPETMVEAPTTVHQETSSEGGTPSGKEGNRKPKREKRAPALERMTKAKSDNATWLFSQKDEFLAAVGNEVKLLEDCSLGAAAFCLRCNGAELVLMFNPTCVDNLTDDQLYGIVGHEIDKAGGWCILEAIKKGTKGGN